MKKALIMTMCTLFCLFSAQVVLADVEGTASAHVNVVVDPNITMEPTGTDVSLNVQTGDISGSSSFRVDANTQYLDFVLTCTNLFKADDPGSEVLPIVAVSPGNINPDSGVGRDIALPVPSTHAFGGLQSGSEQFHSSQNGHFSQNVTVTCTWNQDDPEKPEGDYSGWIELVGMVVPGT